MIILTVFCSLHNVSIFAEEKSIFWFHGDTRVNIASSNSSCIYLYIEASVWDFPVMSMTSPSRLIVNNYWTMFSKISGFVGGEQINYLPKPKAEARHWQITIFCDNRVQYHRSPSLFFNEYLTFCHFQARAIERRRIVRFHLHMNSIIFAAKHRWTTLRMSRPLFAGSYFQVTWWALGQWKGRKICIEW